MVSRINPTILSIGKRLWSAPAPYMVNQPAVLPRITAPARPKLKTPRMGPPGSLRPPRPFSKPNRKGKTPIRYLLTESYELAIARPVPHNSSLIRSLCKGSGILRQNQEGMVYLDIDYRFISAMMPYLKRHGVVQTPHLSFFGPSIGAHIPVIPKREADFHYLGPIKELGKEFTFQIEGLYSLKPDGWPEVEEIWFFKITSPELEAVRRKQFLLSRPLGHSFHIAVAIQPCQMKKAVERPTPYLRVNPALLSA